LNAEDLTKRVDKLATDIDRLYARFGELSTKQAVAETTAKMILEKLDEFKELFRQHDEKEMKKYEEIELNQKKLFKFLYIATGIGIFVSFVGLEGIKKILGG